MLEKVTHIAQQAATNVSRRQFLGRFGYVALVAAGALGTLLALPGEASAGRRCPKGTHPSRCRGGATYCCPPGTKCRDERSGCQ